MVQKVFVNAVKTIRKNPIYILIFLGALSLLSGIRLKAYVDAKWKHKHKSIYSSSEIELERSLLPSKVEGKDKATVKRNERKSAHITLKDGKSVANPTAKQETMKQKSNHTQTETVKSVATPDTKEKEKSDSHHANTVISIATSTTKKEKVKDISTPPTRDYTNHVETTTEIEKIKDKPTQVTTTSVTYVTPYPANRKLLKSNGSQTSTLPVCDHKSKLLGRVDYKMPENTPTIHDTEVANPLVSDGGHFKPPDCTSKWKVAILIPFRNRDIHLYHFLQHMHPILQRQQLDYRIYIINQFGNSTFNRGKLINIGFIEMKKDYDYDCVVLHDVDLVLENDYALYKCLEYPLHLVAAVQKNNYTIKYLQYFGGVTGFSTKQFAQINGFSNTYWGWGGEDDDLLLRVRKIKKVPYRYPADIGRYFMILHDRDAGNEVNPDRYDRLFEHYHSIAEDGLSNLKYKVISEERNRLYTNLTVDVMAAANSMIAKEETVKLSGFDRKLAETLAAMIFNETTP